MTSKQSALLALSSLVVLAGGFWAISMRNQENKSMVKVAITGQFPEGKISPEDISTIALYHLHHNLWDTLVTSARKSAVAKSFSISSDGLTYTFEIDESAKFSNGRPIAAQDVEKSFLRLMALGENGHINAKTTIRSIESDKSQKIKITLLAPTPSFLYLISIPEFGILPAESIDQNGNVNSLAVTSGAYAVRSIDAKAETITLEKNSFFQRAMSDSPALVALNFNSKIDSGRLDDLLKQNFDFIELQNPDAAEFVDRASKNGYAHEITLPSISVFLASSGRLSAKDAAGLAARFQREFSFESSIGSEKRSNQFFPDKTFGSLSKAEIPQFDVPKYAPPKQIRIKTQRTTGSLVSEISRTLKAIGSEAVFVDWNAEEPFDYYFMSQGMNADHPEIELYLDALSPYKFIELAEGEKETLQAAMHDQSDESRSEKLKELSRAILASGRIIPLTVRSYVHLNNPKTLDLNGITGFDGDIPLFRLRSLE